MLDPSYNFDANVLMTPNTGTAATFSGDNTNAALMLANGDYKLWTSGPVAQTILLGDDTTARKYDVGFGDGFHRFGRATRRPSGRRRIRCLSAPSSRTI